MNSSSYSRPAGDPGDPEDSAPRRVNPLAEELHIILVEPSDPLNVGMVARAMSNLGLHHLHLVRPRGYDRQRANITACHGEYLLDTMTIHDDVAPILSPMKEVVAFEPREGRAAHLHCELHEWLPSMRNPELFPCALLFGSEDEGLSNRELEHCRALVSLPTYGPNYSFNLAQSVLLAIFSLSQLSIPAKSETFEPVGLWAEFAQLDTLIKETMTRAGFYSRKINAQIPAILKSLFRRARPSKRDIQILLGVFAQTAKTLRGDSRVVRLRTDAPSPRYRFPEDAETFQDEE